MSREEYTMEKIRIDELEGVAGGNDDAQTKITVELGDVKFDVVLDEISPDELKVAPAKRFRGSLVKAK